MHTSWDVIIAGGGAAGLSAALLLGRSRRRVLVIDAGEPRNRFAEHMHSVLGLDGVAPAELVRRGRAECESYGVEFSPGVVDSVTGDGGELVISSAGAQHRARALVVATGITDELAPIPGLAERWGSTVLHCPFCHGWEVRDQRFGVLATSPMNLHQAELVRQWSDRVVLFAGALDEVPPQTVARLASRGVQVEMTPVVAVHGTAPAIESVELADGRRVELDAIFTGGRPVPHDTFLAGLDLERSDSPFGSFLTVDQVGRTSDPRIWAVGNVVSPMATVPASIGAGAMAGAGLNGQLVAAEFDRAVATGGKEWPEVTTSQYWDEHYEGADQIWSGKVNRVLSRIVPDLGADSPGRALDLGCGEGADVLWLAEQGWDAVGVDVSATAISRAQTAANGSTRAVFVAGDLSAAPAGPYDLVTASFLHAPAERTREEILADAAQLVAPGGHLLITSHAGVPSWADTSHHHHGFTHPQEDLAVIGLAAPEWEILLAETRTRDITSPEDEPATIDDGVILARRVSETGG